MKVLYRYIFVLILVIQLNNSVSWVLKLSIWWRVWHALHYTPQTVSKTCNTALPLSFAAIRQMKRFWSRVTSPAWRYVPQWGRVVMLASPAVLRTDQKHNSRSCNNCWGPCNNDAIVNCRRLLRFVMLALLKTSRLYAHLIYNCARRGVRLQHLSFRFLPKFLAQSAGKSYRIPGKTVLSLRNSIIRR